MKSQKITAQETKEIFGYLIKNNKKLAEENKLPIAYSLVGESGIGKTSVILQLGEELGMETVKLNLSQISIEDLIGFPITEWKMCKDDDCVWVSEKSIPAYTALGFHYANESRMGYSAPKWIANKTEPILLVLDDYSRGSLGMLQAAMELADRQHYISWSLPKGSTVLLTSNPDNGEYIVTTEDSAMKTRFLSFEMRFDINCWAEYAEKVKMDNRC